MDCPPGSPCPLEGRVVRLEALARVTERWATGTAEPTMLRDAGRLVALEARVALCETHQDLEQDWGARLQELERCCTHLPMRERPAPAQGRPRITAANTIITFGQAVAKLADDIPLEPAPAQGQPLCECGHGKSFHNWSGACCSECGCGGYRPKQGLCPKGHMLDQDSEDTPAYCPVCDGRPKQGQPRSCSNCGTECSYHGQTPSRVCDNWRSPITSKPGQPREGGGP